MATLTEAELRAAVENYVVPCSWQSIAEARALRGLSLAGSRLQVALTLGFPVGGYKARLAEELRAHLAQRGFEGQLDLKLTAEIPGYVGQPRVKALAGIANVVAIASGKGGVGKSTVSANLAIALSNQGARVGLLDADIYGPSQPRMFGLSGQRPVSPDGKRMDPLVNYGVKLMSIGFLIDEEQPMAWRGPMVTQALTQLLGDTVWGDLDYLLVDMPPGTGDTQLTMAQQVPLSGAVIVTTPQDIALLDARKGLKMFHRVDVPVLGIVENMSVHVCPNCGHQSHIFGDGGGVRLARQYGTELLGALPLDIRIREQADSGRPTTAAEPDSPLAQAYGEIARRAAGRLAVLAGQSGRQVPKISIEDDA
jgi:ATP-binding protein involved in chromosome partitioning